MENIRVTVVLEDLKDNNLNSVNMLYEVIAYVGNVLNTSSNKQCRELVIVDHINFQLAKVICYFEEILLLLREDQQILLEHLIYRDNQFIITSKSIYNNMGEQQLGAEIKGAARQLFYPQPTLISVLEVGNKDVTIEGIVHKVRFISLLRLFILYTSYSDIVFCMTLYYNMNLLYVLF